MQEATVFEDVCPGIPCGEAKIQYLFAIETADTAGAGAETVDEPGELRKGRNLEDANVSGGTGEPARADGFILRGVAAGGTPSADCFRSDHEGTSIIAVVRMVEIG